MPPVQITLVRHGESQHNIFKEHDRYPDALLTSVGELQAVQISTFFPVTPPIDLIVTSPLRRALQTTRLAFSRQINQQGLVPIALPELQESSNKPCNIGSPVMILEQQWPGIDFTLVRAVETGKDERGDWRSKIEKWSQEGDALKERARWVRKWLYQRKEAHVVCVLHANFLHHLTDDWTSFGPKTWTKSLCGWNYAEFRSYTFAPDSDPENPELIETQASRELRAKYLPEGANVQVVGPYVKIREVPLKARYGRGKAGDNAAAATGKDA